MASRRGNPISSLSPASKRFTDARSSQRATTISLPSTVKAFDWHRSSLHSDGRVFRENPRYSAVAHTEGYAAKPVRRNVAVRRRVAHPQCAVRRLVSRDRRTSPKVDPNCHCVTI